MSDLLGFLGFAGNLFGGVADAAIASANLQMQQQQFNYQQQLQQTMFSREDTAVQRRVADLRAAGLSPTLAAGSGAQAGPVVSTQAPQLNLSVQDKFAKALQSSQLAMGLAAQKAAIDQTQAQTALIQQQAESTRLSNQFASASMADRVEQVFNDARLGELRNYSERRQAEALFQLIVNNASKQELELLSNRNTQPGWWAEAMQLALGVNTGDPRVRQMWDKVQAEIRAVDVGRQLDENELLYRQGFGNYTRGAREVLDVIGGTANAVRGRRGL